MNSDVWKPILYLKLARSLLKIRSTSSWMPTEIRSSNMLKKESRSLKSWISIWLTLMF